MLVLDKIIKDYITGDTKVRALDNVSLAFRKNEFVSVLGHSGCGKTTLLNLIGGLDKYTDGVMSIKGVSTEQYTESDWDTYRNHSIGFVFQSYNLIPHQTVLSNVELALTLSGVSKAERRKRAEEALISVGLGDQIHKKPSQMSGGQMQRVAIARALVNDPEILLADEPTGALDTDTSVQIMDILKEISKDKLIIMVTHNPELADRYSDRIIRLSDGKVVGDTNPFSPEDEAKEVAEIRAAEAIIQEQAEAKMTEQEKKKSRKKGKKRKPSMSFLTALSLSFNNLLTKKTRTFLVSFAGSIGIIGIALILSLSNGINAFITRVQKETLSSYPITLQKEEVDMTALITSLMAQNETVKNPDPDKVYVNPVTYGMLNSMLNPETTQNNLKKFKEYLESGKSGIEEYAQAIKYNYNVTINPYLTDANNNYYKAEVNDLFNDIMGRIGMSSGSSSSSMMMYGQSMWQEMLPPEKGSDDMMHSMIKTQYDLIAGSWPKDKSEVVLLVNKDNTITDLALYSLGLYTADQIFEIVVNTANGLPTDTNVSYEFDKLIYTGENDTEYISYKLVPSSAYYKNDGSGWHDLRTAENKEYDLKNVIESGLGVKISGIIRQNPEATAGALSGTIIYTSALTDYLLDAITESDIVKAQKADETKDVFTGLPFEYKETLTDEQKPAAFISYLKTANEKKRAEIFSAILAEKSTLDAQTAAYLKMIGIEAPNGEADYKEKTIQKLKAYGIITDGDAAYQFFNMLSSEALYAQLKEYASNEVVKQINDNAQAEINQILSVPDIVERDGERAKSIYRYLLAKNQYDIILSFAGYKAEQISGMSPIDKAVNANNAVTLLVRQTDILVNQNSLPSNESEYTYPISSQLAQTITISEPSMRSYISYRLTSTTTFAPDEIETLVNGLSGEGLKAKFFLELDADSLVNYQSVTAQAQSQERKDRKLAAELMKRVEAGVYDDRLVTFYDDESIVVKVSPTTLEENYETMGLADKADPDSILLYAKSFEDKEFIESIIAEYNEKQKNEDDKITYTDYVGLIMSSVTSIIDAITYVLIFFVSISLVVSSIMIGIITYISVLERTKEIGILRAIGASKRDISRVFNAETLIVGFAAGMIGIIVTVILNIPIALIIKHFSGISGLASLPILAAVVLVVISMVLTLISGLIPSGIAAKKDPVESLRSE